MYPIDGQPYWRPTLLCTLLILPVWRRYWLGRSSLFLQYFTSRVSGRSKVLYNSTRNWTSEVHDLKRKNITSTVVYRRRCSQRSSTIDLLCWPHLTTVGMLWWNFSTSRVERVKMGHVSPITPFWGNLSYNIMTCCDQFLCHLHRFRYDNTKGNAKCTNGVIWMVRVTQGHRQCHHFTFVLNRKYAPILYRYQAIVSYGAVTPWRSNHCQRIPTYDKFGKYVAICRISYLYGLNKLKAR